MHKHYKINIVTRQTKKTKQNKTKKNNVNLEDTAKSVIKKTQPRNEFVQETKKSIWNLYHYFPVKLTLCLIVNQLKTCVLIM